MNTKVNMINIAKSLLFLRKLLHPRFLADIRKQRKFLENSQKVSSSLFLDTYNYFLTQYHFTVPTQVRQHRRYFEVLNRGCGESAFHAAWFHIMMKYRPKNLLEIGVYRGQIISLWQLIASCNKYKVDILGISPFDGRGDSVSSYLQLDYLKDVHSNFEHFSLKNATLVQGVSTSPNAIAAIKSRAWDLVYIDGSHDYEDCLHDYKLCLENLSPGGIMCLDDSSMYIPARIDGRYLGHPGPSSVLLDFAIKEMTYLFTVGHNNFFQKTF